MLDFQQKRKIRSVAYNKITILVIFLFILVLARSTWIVYQKKRISDDIKNVSLQNVEELRTRSDELRSKIERLDTVVGVEEEIRLKFNVVKNEEKMVVIVEEENSHIATTTSKVSFWQKVISWFRD